MTTASTLELYVKVWFQLLIDNVFIHMHGAGSISLGTRLGVAEPHPVCTRRGGDTRLADGRVCYIVWLPQSLIKV